VDRAPLPECDAVICIGECLNYRFGPARSLARFFPRVYAALRPGAVFVFDAATPDRIPAGSSGRQWMEGAGWVILVEARGDRRRNTLARSLVTFRKVVDCYRRSEERHHLQLYRFPDKTQALDHAGFEARELRAFGRFRLPRGVRGFAARKPA